MSLSDTLTDMLFTGHSSRTRKFYLKVIRPISIVIGTAGLLGSVYFNLLFLTPVFTGERAQDRVANLMKGGHNEELIFLIPLIAASIFISWFITDLEVRGRASSLKSDKYKMYGGYTVGSITNWLGMMTYPTDNFMILLGRVIAAIIFEYGPEEMLSGAAYFGDESDKTEDLRVDDFVRGMQGQIVDGGAQPRSPTPSQQPKGGAKAPQRPAQAPSAPPRMITFQLPQEVQCSFIDEKDKRCPNKVGPGSAQARPIEVHGETEYYIPCAAHLNTAKYAHPEALLDWVPYDLQTQAPA